MVAFLQKVFSPRAIILGVLCLYLVCSFLNVAKYYRSIGCEGNYDAYGPYIGRAMILNFPARSIDRALALSFHTSQVLEICDPNHSVEKRASALAVISVEIIFTDFVLGPLIWLALLMALFYRCPVRTVHTGSL